VAEYLFAIIRPGVLTQHKLRHFRSSHITYSPRH